MITRSLLRGDNLEAREYTSKAYKLGLINIVDGNLILDLAGWERLVEITKTTASSDQAFVAMWFDDSMHEAWHAGIRAALADLGWNPVRIDLVEHNDMIDDRIIAEIRRSGLVVADFTGQRHGVYFEAGVALGLGIPVVRTCRYDDLGNLHFDTRQFSHVIWQTPSELYERLSIRIRATVPRLG